MSDHLKKRQNVLPVSETEERLEAVAQALGESWLLEAGAHPLQELLETQRCIRD
jgi:hypothetical protein